MPAVPLLAGGAAGPGTAAPRCPQSPAVCSELLSVSVLDEAVTVKCSCAVPRRAAPTRPFLSCSLAPRSSPGCRRGRGRGLFGM